MACVVKCGGCGSYIGHYGLCDSCEIKDLKQKNEALEKRVKELEKSDNDRGMAGKVIAIH